jgi:phospholipid/cholesterol/gamma-HCH transport system substrate-binding protein
MMETNISYTAAGAFVIALFAAIIVTIIWLSAGLTVEHFTRYKVYMKEAVSGLSLDAPVEYNGVNVGAVKSIKINRKNPQLVELLLDVNDGAPITQGTRAKLDIRSLTGVAYISLRDTGTNMTPLVALPGQEYPIINTTPSILVRLDTTLTQLNYSFKQISESFHQVSISVRSLMDQQNLNSIKQILVNLQVATEQITPLLKTGKSSMQLIQTQTVPAANQAFINMDKVTDNLFDVSNQLKQNPARLIRGNAQQELGPGEK